MVLKTGSRIVHWFLLMLFFTAKVKIDFLKDLYLWLTIYKVINMKDKVSLYICFL